MLSYKNEVQPVANGIRQRIKIRLLYSVTFVDPGVQIDMVIFIHTIMCRDRQTDREDENNTINTAVKKPHHENKTIRYNLT